jgi:flagellar basal body L-ring protein FlgH
VPSYGGAHRGFGRKLASLDHEFDEDSRAEGPLGGREESAAPAPAEYRRVTRQDFVDKDASENSLWDGQGQGNFLFSQNRRREPGDLITADVEKELKREIQYQLWLTLPPELRKTRRAPASMSDGKPVADPKVAADPKAAAAANAKSAEEKNKDAAEEAAKTNMAGGGKDEDVVRMEVAEGLGNGLVRVVGQKRVIYRGVARLVEVTALVNGKDVDDNNRVKSSAFLDTKAQVIQ